MMEDACSDICDIIERVVPTKTARIRKVGVYEMSSDARVAAFCVYRPIIGTKYDELSYLSIGFDSTGTFTHCESPILSESVANCFADSGDQGNTITEVVIA